MKRIMVAILMCSLVLSCGLSFADLTNEHTLKADALKAIGLFSGSSKGYELDRAPNRVEAAVMLVRLLGKETEVKANVYSHPFTDVPAWANNYVGYMYINQLSKGISETEFGSDKLVDANSYATFVLRALGYSDMGGDFAWTTALDFAAEKGILTQAEKKNVFSQRFLRDELVLLSYGTLKASLKDSEKKLVSQLIETQVVDLQLAERNGFFKQAIESVVDEIKPIIQGSIKNIKFDKKNSFYSSGGNANLGIYRNPSHLVAKDVELINFFAKSVGNKEQNIFVKLDFYANGKKVQSLYDLCSINDKKYSSALNIPSKTYDEVRYMVFEASLEQFNAQFGVVPYYQMPVSKAKEGIELMKSAEYVNLVLLSDKETFLSNIAGYSFFALTYEVLFSEANPHYYYDSTAFNEKGAITNGFKTLGKFNKDVDIEIVLESGNLTQLSPHRSGPSSGAIIGYSLYINPDNNSLFILRDKDYNPIGIIEFVK